MFRLLLFSFLYLSSLMAWGQAVFRLDSLPANGVRLDKGWKWHLGDNPDWVKPDFDDSKWKPIDPTQDIFDLPQLPKTGEIFWLRLHLAVDTALNQQLVMTIQQAGASEVYLNGKRFRSFGLVSKNAESVKASNPFTNVNPFQFKKSVSQVLAVRYAFQPHLLYTKQPSSGILNRTLFVIINTTEHWFDTHRKYEKSATASLLTFGISITLFFIYFTFYLFDKRQQGNFYFSLYTFLITIIYGLFYYYKYDTSEQYWFANLGISLYVTANLFLLVAVYKLFNQKMGLFFWIELILGLLSIFLTMIFYGWGYRVFDIGFNYAITLEMTRVSIVGVLKNKKRAWIIAIGAFLMFMSWFILQSFGNQPFIQDYIYVLALTSQVALPISIAIFIGYNFAQTNRSLQKKLIEIQVLSTEKQQLLSSQNEQLEAQVEARTAELKASQAQLVQKEKLASLGELTAGIAHEIQNPLNFVNNFSEVSTELVKEIQEERQKGQERDEELEAELLDDLSQNLQKIHHHGGRASNIVKGMLEHSRTSTGEHQRTDLNALADEYLRLAYQGQRAKDKNFTCELVTDFDPALGEVEVVPQELGRVLLNLYNNAFYTVWERQKQRIDMAYQPRVEVSTCKEAARVVIQVKDNGMGISEAVQAKIFQPFFTTKPTGEGTGLGLSLSYDIVTKGHGGTLGVESQVEVGSVFTIHLPQADQSNSHS